MADRKPSNFTVVTTVPDTAYFPFVVPGDTANYRILKTDFVAVIAGTSAGTTAINPTDTFLPMRLNGSKFGDSPWSSPLPGLIYADSGASFIHHDLTSGSSFFFHVASSALKIIGPNYVGLQVPSIGENYALAAAFFTVNTTPATPGAQQFSPALTVQGGGYSTFYGTSQYLAFGAVAAPAEGSPDIGGQYQIVSAVNNSSPRVEFAVARNSGYSGSGLKFLSDDGAYHVPPGTGSGGFINPTETYVPARQSGTLVDSALRMMPDYGPAAMGFDQVSGLGTFMLISPSTEFVMIQGASGNGDWNTIGKGLYYSTCYNVVDPLNHLPYPQGLLLYGETNGGQQSNSPGVRFAGRALSNIVGFPDVVNVGAYLQTFNSVGVAQPTGKLVFKSFIGTNPINSMMEFDLLGNGTLNGNLSVSQVVNSVGTVPTSSAISGTIYYDMTGPAYQVTTVDAPIQVSAINVTPGAAINVTLISNGIGRAVTYDANFAWFGTQVAFTSPTAGRRVAIALSSLSSSITDVQGASQPQVLPLPL